MIIHGINKDKEYYIVEYESIEQYSILYLQKAYSKGNLTEEVKYQMEKFNLTWENPRIKTSNSIKEGIEDDLCIKGI